jgi:hypothetical protein
MGTNQISEIQRVGDGAGLVTSAPAQPDPVVPEGFELYQNYPNPFNPSTTFRFHLPVDARVRIAVYGSAGQEIDALVDGWMESGLHELRWSPVGIASGIYLCEIHAGSHRESIKMIFQK